MKRLVDAVQVLVLVGTVLFVVALFTNDGSSPPAASPADGAVDGAEVYGRHCAACHGIEGEGVSGPALGDGAVVAAYPDPADQVEVVTEGRAGGMPAFGGSLTAEEVEAVVDHTRNDL
ncbi:MAG TPA: cytochrome c [Acidimicrobiales bacterium]|nr:cytochrome c [Acidimicrobiales bacterium]